MIHPDSGDIIAVGNELARLAANDRRITAVDPYTCIIIQQQAANLARLHYKQGKTILPEIAPAASPSPVVMVGQKRVSV
ncbi:hypothetical protein D3C73_851980 [compost metagenome]